MRAARMGWLAAVLLASSGCIFELLSAEKFDREPSRREDKTNGDVFIDVPPGSLAQVFGRAAQQAHTNPHPDAAGLDPDNPDDARRLAEIDFDRPLRIDGLTAGGHHVGLSRDDDGDGAADARADVTVELTTGVRVNPGTNPFGGEEENVVSSVVVGVVALTPTTRVTGTILVDDGGVERPASEVGATARVVAFRTVNAGSGFTGARALEAEATADDEGNFVLDGVGEGAVEIIAFIFDGEDNIGDTLAVTPTRVETLVTAQESDIGTLVADLAAALPNVAVFVEARPPFGLDEQVTLRFWRRGSAKRPECVPDVDDQVELDLGDPNPALPAGLYDLVVCSSGGAVRTAPGLVVAPGAERAFADLANLDILPVVNGDLDNDLLPGLPLYFVGENPPAAWLGCVAACENAHGAANAAATCTFEGTVFDCDDDGDLQADVTEPVTCYGIGLGGDRDGDGLCDPDDPFPWCAANTAADCDADTREHNPSVPVELQ